MLHGEPFPAPKSTPVFLPFTPGRGGRGRPLGGFPVFFAVLYNNSGG